ncbi:MAG: hypothetical protein KAT32_01890 [Candidatus Moranbacteria bacterium]|nr:hypothetical protein [Candidatus Moranbacteria bacterium]
MIIPKARDKTGESRGAISIEAMSTAMLLISNPQVAMDTDMITRKKNVGRGVESSIRSLMASILFSSFMFSNSKLIIIDF